MFHFKRFSIEQAGATHPVGTDGVLLGAWADVENCQRILDVGTGTGLVALMLAQRSAAKIVGVEMHPPSAELARRNFEASPWAERIEAVEDSIQNFAQHADLQYDLIVSNPPFFSETTISPDASRRLGRHTASLAAGELLAVSKKLLTEKGRLCVILPTKEGRRFCEMAALKGLYCTEEVEVHTRPQKPVERLLLRFENNHPFYFEKKQLALYAAEEGYSEDFQRLTKEFYL